jgi:hypothetical protein
MKNAGLPHGDDRAQRLHRLRRVVAWVALIVLGLGLTSVLSAATCGTSAPWQAVRSATGAH